MKKDVLFFLNINHETPAICWGYYLCLVFVVEQIIKKVYSKLSHYYLFYLMAFWKLNITKWKKIVVDSIIQVRKQYNDFHYSLHSISFNRKL